MTYAELTALLQATVENEFTADQLALFFQASEEKLYNVCQPPALRGTQTGSLTAGSPYFTTPSGFLYAFSLAVVDGSGGYNFLLDKDVNFIREAYPVPDSSGLPKHYAIFDEDRLILGPTPVSAYSVELQYARYPESITTAGTSWVGDNYPTALLNLAVVEAAKFLKLEQDTMGVYLQLATESLALVKNASDGKLRQDTYRSGQVSIGVK